MDDIKVSVICLVYNHAQFLRPCLDGFVMQKTNFKFEVIIHDDASTDGSADIIREYAAKHPDIFVPIYQNENQYSQGKGIVKPHMYPKTKGEYVAWCEGDDCWTHPEKLQRQVDFLDSHPDFVACTHRALVHKCSTNTSLPFPNLLKSREYLANEIIRKSTGLPFATASLMMRKETLFTMPDVYLAKGFGDIQKYIYSAIEGRLWCLEDIMSIYNSGTNGSFTMRMRQNNEKRAKHFKEFINLMDRLDSYYDFKYHDAFDFAKKTCEVNLYMLTGDKESLKKDVYKPFVKVYRLAKIKNFIAYRFPIIKKVKVLVFKK